MIELHMFTNCTHTSPSTDIIERTYESFKTTFGELPVTVWVDPHPNIESYDLYKKNLMTLFPCVRDVRSLSDGYINAILASKSPFLFMLEHDWIFHTDRINHSLDDILDRMMEDGII